MTTKLTPVTIDERLIERIGVREWGLPSMVMPGNIWRSEEHGTISCMLPHPTDPKLVRTETRPLVITPPDAMSEMPDSWRAAMWEYVQAWPDSGHGLGPFLAITEKERCDFIRKWALELAASDDIGCCSIANSIGEFAAYGFRLVADRLPNHAAQPQTER